MMQENQETSQQGPRQNPSNKSAQPLNNQAPPQVQQPPQECMTRSSTKDLLTHFKEPERVLHSTRKLFKTLSLDYSSSPKFNLISDIEDQCEEEVTGSMTELTVEECMTITRKDYDLGINEKGMIELKGRFLLELRDNAFSGTNGEDAVEHIENFLKIVDLLNVPNVTLDRLRIEINGANIKVKWDPTNIEFKSWLAPKFRNHETMDQYTKNALWDYWRREDDKEVITNNELFNPRDDKLIEENKIAQIFKIKTDIFCFETPLCEAFKEFSYLSQIDVDVLIKDILGFKTYEEYKGDWIYE
ncbi:hypothetical protein Tco_0413659 [Tanacetum coccineum]